MLVKIIMTIYFYNKDTFFFLRSMGRYLDTMWLLSHLMVLASIATSCLNQLFLY